MLQSEPSRFGVRANQEGQHCPLKELQDILDLRPVLGKAEQQLHL